MTLETKQTTEVINFDFTQKEKDAFRIVLDTLTELSNATDNFIILDAEGNKIEFYYLMDTLNDIINKYIEFC